MSICNEERQQQPLACLWPPRRLLRYLARLVLWICVAGSATQQATAQATADVGSMCDATSKLQLWDAARDCLAYFKKDPKNNHTFAGCLWITNEYVLVKGEKGANPPHNFLTVATDRISGIECYKVWQPSAPNYFQDAFLELQAGGRASVKGWPGMAINSTTARSQNQFHIHMAPLLAGVPPQIKQQAAHITTSPAKWRDSIICISGQEGDPPNTHITYRPYRALRIMKLTDTNPFALLYEYVANKQDDQMVHENLIVTPVDPNHPGDGFYLLNSDGILNDPTPKSKCTGSKGIGSIDQLFDWN